MRPETGARRPQRGQMRPITPEGLIGPEPIQNNDDDALCSHEKPRFPSVSDSGVTCLGNDTAMTVR